MGLAEAIYGDGFGKWHLEKNCRISTAEAGRPGRRDSPNELVALVHGAVEEDPEAEFTTSGACLHGFGPLEPLLGVCYQPLGLVPGRPAGRSTVAWPSLGPGRHPRSPGGVLLDQQQARPGVEGDQAADYVIGFVLGNPGIALGHAGGQLLPLFFTDREPDPGGHSRSERRPASGGQQPVPTASQGGLWFGGKVEGILAAGPLLEGGAGEPWSRATWPW